VTTLQACEDSRIRVAALWCVVNLTWPTDVGSEARVQRLTEMGFASRLRELLIASEEDTGGKFGEQLRTCIQHFRQSSSSLTVSSSRTLPDQDAAMPDIL
jgi:hypothetical protein